MKAAQRNALKDSQFAYQDRSYPINDKAHARNALARAAQSNTKGSYETVARKVKAKFPDIQTKGSSGKPAAKTTKATPKAVAKKTTAKATSKGTSRASKARRG